VDVSPRHFYFSIFFEWMQAGARMQHPNDDAIILDIGTP
jgi:hypothetical protein